MEAKPGDATGSDGRTEAASSSHSWETDAQQAVEAVFTEYARDATKPAGPEGGVLQNLLPWQFRLLLAQELDPQSSFPSSWKAQLRPSLARAGY